ncbi:hypothetical protein ACOI1C_13415 [Bacillus sp. DJP31]|uniref:hypothetical protein n=1 Tax=Bacillus sp. DJP31 TaxID=3409789 RepID=UPI003BB4F6CF
MGPLQFLYGKDSNEVYEKFNKKKSNWLKDLEKENKKLSQEYEKLQKKEIPRVKKDINHKEEWDNLLSYDPSNQFTTAATTYKVLGVTRLWQRSSGVNNPDSACGPATAAMVSNYLKSLFKKEDKKSKEVRGSEVLSTGAYVLYT